MIRAATKEDVEKIASIEMSLFDNSMSPRQLELELEAGEGFVMGDPVFGYAILRHDGNLIDLVRLAVTQTHQGLGYGKELLEAVLALGKIVILTVKKNNELALGLYMRRGFKVVGHYPSATSWVMRWEPAVADDPSL